MTSVFFANNWNSIFQQDDPNHILKLVLSNMDPKNFSDYYKKKEKKKI